ncbi:MAG: class I SAM-dependent rRNA methyltransferase [Crocinitomicaceae bacterium]|nr:class I SAM-dependent rRNA methyltransferase [Crocinitomicaceae bacterium]
MKKQVQLYKNKLESLQRKHPWVFSGAIDLASEDLKDGDVVEVLDYKSNFIAVGHFQNATIAVRILSFEREEINQQFFDKKIKNAVELRRKLNLFRADNNTVRLVHGEGDGLPGLIVDYYNKVAVIQCHSLGMYNSVELIVEGLKNALKEDVVAIYNKSSDTVSSKVNANDQYVWGSVETPHVALENGVKFNIDWVNGQKTGFFIDQRENRALLGKYANGKTILNTFCYSGGFSLLALKNGAELVHSLDSSAKAIQLTDDNIALNQFENHQSIVADAVDYLKELPEQYDIIVLDPPAFAKHRDKRHKAVQGYKRLNANAIRQIKPGGILFTFSCSQVIDKQLFTNTIIAAAIEVGRSVRIIEQLHQPADHPISAYHPEGEYLKGLVLAID